MQPTPQAYSSFLIRFWWEPAQAAPAGVPEDVPSGAWQATVEHIQSGEQSAVTNVAAIAQFLVEHAGPNPILSPADQTLK
jgi:hypothetical protein